MNLNVTRNINNLRSMTVKALRGKYIEVFGEETRSCNKDFLWKRIAWRMQALEEGNISERGTRRAEELADDADLRVRMPADILRSNIEALDMRTESYSFQPNDIDRRLPMPGAILCREYKGKTIRVMVLDKGFEFNGNVYRSLTAIAKMVTGSKWNGFHFFGLHNKKVKV